MLHENPLAGVNSWSCQFERVHASDPIADGKFARRIHCCHPNKTVGC